MDSKPIQQPVLRFKPLSSNSPPVEGMSDLHGSHNPSDSSNLSLDDVIKAPVRKEEETEELVKEEPETGTFELQSPPDIINRPETDDDDENDDVIKVKPPRPPRKKVKEVLKEPLYEEDIIEGFSFVGFKTYEDLEQMTAWSAEHHGKFPDPYSKLKLSHEKNKDKMKKKKKHKERDRDRDRERHHRRNNSEKADTFSFKNLDRRTKTGSSGSSSEKGYICDSDSDGDKGSENGSSEFFNGRGEVCRNDHLSRPPTTMISNCNQAGFMKQERLPASESLSSPRQLSASSGVPPVASNSNSSHKLYRPYSTSPPPSAKKPSLAASPILPNYSSQSYPTSLSSTGVPHYSSVPYYPDEKPNSLGLTLKPEGSLLKPSAPGLSTGFGMGNPYTKHLKSDGNLAGTLDLSSHSSKPFQQPYGLPLPPGLGGIENYSALRNSLQSGIGQMPPPSAQRPLQGNSSALLPESSPQSDWLRRDLESRFMQPSPDRNGPRGLTSPFMLPHPSQSPLGPTGPFVRPGFPPQSPTASFLSRSLEMPKIGPSPNSSLPGFPSPLGSMSSPLSFRPSGSFASPTFQPNLPPKKSGKWNAMHVRIAWEIYNHQQKQTRSQLPHSQSSLGPLAGLGITTSSGGSTNINSLSTTNGDLRMSGTDLSKKSLSSDMDKSKFSSPVVTRPTEKSNPFGLGSLVSPSTSRVHSSPNDILTSSSGPLSFPQMFSAVSSMSGLSSAGYLAGSSGPSPITTSAPSFPGLGSLHDPVGFSAAMLPPNAPLGIPDPFGLTRSLFSSVPGSNHRTPDYMSQHSRLNEEHRERERAHQRHLEERDRREQRKREEILSGKRSPLHLSHRSPAPERSPLSTASGAASPMVSSSKRDGSSSSASMGSSYMRSHSEEDKNEVTIISEKRVPNPTPSSSHRSSASHSISKSSLPVSSSSQSGLSVNTPGSFSRQPLPGQHPFPGFGAPGGLPTYMDPRSSLGLYGSMLPPIPPSNPGGGLFGPGMDPFRDPYRGLNPFLKDHMAERDLLNRFNTLIANEQDRQRLAMSSGYPPGLFPSGASAAASAAAFLGNSGLGGKLPSGGHPPHMGMPGMYPGFPGLGGPPGGLPSPLTHPRLDIPGLGGHLPPPDHNMPH